MAALQLSRHAVERMAQRGLAMSDLDLILELGSEVEDGFLVLAKDCQEIERTVKQFLARVRRLKGKRVVVTNGCLVTAFHASRAEEKRLCRGRNG